jgi:hypothetical protein
MLTAAREDFLGAGVRFFKDAFVRLAPRRLWSIISLTSERRFGDEIVMIAADGVSSSL